MNSNIQTQLRSILFCLCAAINLGALKTAHAADDALPTKTVSYADLDISKPAGAKVLNRRIVAAAHQVCAYDGTHDLATLAWQRSCTNQAIDSAVKSIDSVALSGLRTIKVIHLASN
jgi:UrcA family protein